MKPRRIVFVFLGSILALAVTARAQDATLSGTVTDATDAVLPGVTVTALLVETGNTFVGVTDGSGNYRISVRPGVYKVTAELAGFTTVTRENLQMLVGQAALLALKMTLATVSESVTVSGEAPLIDTTQSSLGGNVDPRQMQALPVNGRNWMQLTMLAPGSRSNDAGASPAGGTTPGTDSGSQGEAGYFQLVVDGQQVAATQAQSNFGQPKYARDAIAEFQFISGRFDATNGRSMGVLVNAVTKSGTNTVSGSGFGYFRHDTFNAADFVAKRVLPYSNQQMGGTLGGPLIKDKMHIFGYYEAEREPTTLVFTSRFPRFNIDRHVTRVEHLAGVRVDRQLTQRTRLMVRANGWENDLPVNVVSGFSSATTHPSNLQSLRHGTQQVYGVLTKMIGQRSVNELKPGWHLTFHDPDNICCFAARINLAGYSIGAGNTRTRLYPRVWAIRDDLTTVWGRHEVKMGADYTHNHDMLEWHPSRYGILQADGGPIPANIEDLFPVWDDPSTWNLAPLSPISVRWTESFTTCSEISGGCGYSYVHVTKNAATWIQDNWTVTPRLTLNLGLRYDLPIDALGEKFDFLPLRHKTPHDKNNFAPRLGAAYTLDTRTVLRGGWGKYFHGTKDQWIHHIKPNLQLANIAVLNDGRPDFASNPFNGVITNYEQAVNSGIVRDTVGRIIQVTAQVPYSYQGSMGFQRQLGETMSVQADFVWTGARHEETGSGGNTNLSYDPATGANYPFRDISKRPWPYLGITNQYDTEGQSNYRALETSFSKRFSQSWQASATYTLSRYRDYVTPPKSGATGFVTFPLAADIAGNWAYAVGDQRHRAVVNGLWDLPYNLQLSGVYHYGSGQQYGSNWGTDRRDSGNLFNRLRPDGTIAPRDNLVGTPIHRVDLRVLQRFALQGSVRLEGSFEVFNLFNHANYTNFVTAEVSRSYGQPQLSQNVAYLPRMLQLGFRITF